MHRFQVLFSVTIRSRLTHAILAPTVLRFDRTADGADSGLEFVAGDGTKTILRFAASARPELVDGSWRAASQAALRTTLEPPARLE